MNCLKPVIEPSIHVKWVHCHHGMARPRVADRGYGLQIWRVAVNILNKQSRTADSGWSSSLGFGWESPKERDHWEDQGVGGKMGSEWILGRLAWGVWIGFDCLRTETGGGLL
jgi:hypothetical protein